MTPLKDLISNLSIRSRTPRPLRHVASSPNNNHNTANTNANNYENERSGATTPSFSRVPRQLYNLVRISSRAELDATPVRPATSLGYYHAQVQTLSPDDSHDYSEMESQRRGYVYDGLIVDGDRDDSGIRSRGRGHRHVGSSEPLVAGPEYAPPRTSTPLLSTMSGTDNNYSFSPSPSPSSSPSTAPKSSAMSTRQDRFRTDYQSSTTRQRGIRRSQISIARSNSVPGSRARRKLSENLVIVSNSISIVDGRGTPTRPPRPDERAATEMMGRANNALLTIEEALASPLLLDAPLFPTPVLGQEFAPRIILPERSPRRPAGPPPHSRRTDSPNNSSSTTPQPSPPKFKLKMKRSASTVRQYPITNEIAKTTTTTTTGTQSATTNKPLYEARGPRRAEREPNVEKLDEWWSDLGAEKKMAAKEMFESLSGLFDSTYPCLIPRDAYEGSYLHLSDQEGF